MSYLRRVPVVYSLDNVFEKACMCMLIGHNVYGALAQAHSHGMWYRIGVVYTCVWYRI